MNKERWDRAASSARLRAVLCEEFVRRKSVNRRYSLRAFSRSLQIDHSTLSQLLRGSRTFTPRAVQRLGSRLRWIGSPVRAAALAPAGMFDSRKLATELNLTVDAINLMLTDLCLWRVTHLKGPHA